MSAHSAHDRQDHRGDREKDVRRSVIDLALAVSEEISEAEWKALPRDLSTNLDHYLYGVGKEDD